MPDGAIEFQLGNLSGEVRSAHAAIKGMREEGQQREGRILDAIDKHESSILGRIEQHDKRDDERFDAVGSRLGTLERQNAVFNSRENTERRADDHSHAWRAALHTAAIAAAASLGGALIAGLLPLLFNHGGH